MSVYEIAGIKVVDAANNIYSVHTQIKMLDPNQPDDTTGVAMRVVNDFYYVGSPGNWIDIYGNLPEKSVEKMLDEIASIRILQRKYAKWITGDIEDFNDNPLLAKKGAK